MKKYILLKHKSSAPRYRTESLADLMKKLELINAEGGDLEEAVVLEIDGEDLRNSPPICKAARDFFKSSRKGP